MYVCVTTCRYVWMCMCMCMCYRVHTCVKRRVMHGQRRHFSGCAACRARGPRTSAPDGTSFGHKITQERFGYNRARAANAAVGARAKRRAAAILLGLLLCLRCNAESPCTSRMCLPRQYVALLKQVLLRNSALQRLHVARNHMQMMAEPTLSLSMRK